MVLCIVFASTGRTQDGGTWEPGAAMPVRRQELATGALNGRVYVLGGYDENRNSTATVEAYNPTTNTWAFAHPLPFAVNHNAAEERINAIVERSAILDTSKFVRIAVDWLLRSDIGEVIKTIVHDEEAFPDYQIQKKATERKKRRPKKHG